MAEGIEGLSCLCQLSTNPPIFSHIQPVPLQRGLSLCISQLATCWLPTRAVFFSKQLEDRLHQNMGVKQERRGHQSKKLHREGEKEFPGQKGSRARGQGCIPGATRSYLVPGMFKHNEGSSMAMAKAQRRSEDW